MQVSGQRKNPLSEVGKRFREKRPEGTIRGEKKRK